MALLAALPLVPRPAGFIGSLTNAGVDEREAPIYAEGVRRGGTLVAARVDDDEVLRGATPAVPIERPPVPRPGEIRVGPDGDFPSSAIGARCGHGCGDQGPAGPEDRALIEMSDRSNLHPGTALVKHPVAHPGL